MGGGSPHADQIYLWSPQFKRPVALEYTGKMKVEGVSANRFEITDAELDPTGVANIPGLKGVQKSEIGIGQTTCKREAACLQAFKPSHLKGLVDVTPHEGFAAFVSRPHFDDAAPQLREDVTLIGNGMNEDFSTYMAVEPASGKTILGHKRLQVATGSLRPCSRHPA